jgi:Ni,Fe-hydrogenase III small subunit
LGAGGVDALLAVDVYVPGSPPPPIAIMHGLLLATGLLVNDAVAL